MIYYQVVSLGYEGCIVLRVEETVVKHFNTRWEAEEYAESLKETSSDD